MINLQPNVPMSNFTTLAIGGPAKEFVEVSIESELLELLLEIKHKNLPFMTIGGGSNLLVSDQGIDKLVIKNSLAQISQNENILTVKSGTPLQDLVDFAIENGLSGIQKLTGIPGTVGGAIYGNAGAYGQSISDSLIEVKAFDPNYPNIANGIAPNVTLENSIKVLSKNDCGFDYRDSNFKRNGLIILEAKFQLTPADAQDLTVEATNILSQRLAKYPVGVKCPGSFFKNIIAQNLPAEILAQVPQNKANFSLRDKIIYGKIPAGALLEAVGAKGAKLGNIEIAPYHANLFINKGHGTAQDFYNLAKMYAQKVKETFGISLEPEVQLINLPTIN